MRTSARAGLNSKQVFSAATKKALEQGETFEVEMIEPGEWVSIFPHTMADKSYTHESAAEAWEWIAECIMEGKRKRV